MRHYRKYFLTSILVVAGLALTGCDNNKNEMSTTEAENPALEQYGDDRLLEFLRNCSYESAQQVIETITADIERHRDGAEPNDDLTMMILKLS